MGMPMRRLEGREMLALDVYEPNSDLKVEASLPGFKPEVDISIVGNMLNIKAEMEREAGATTVSATRAPAGGRFLCRRMSMATRLKLTLPKVEEAKPKRIEVKSKKK